MLGGQPDDALIGVPGLEDDRSGIAAPPAAAGELREQAERALLAAEVGPGEALVGVDRGRQAEIAEVVALGDHLRADEHGRGLAREALERRVEAAAPLGGVGVEPEHRDVRQQLAHGLADALGARAEPCQLDRSAVRALRGRALRVAAVVAAQAPARVQREAHVAALAAEPLAAAAAVQRGRLSTPVEQEDRPSALVGEAHEAAAQRARERVEPVAPEVDDLDARQIASHARRQRCAREARPALRPRRRRAQHEHGAFEPRALGSHAPGVVARVVALLVGRFVLLVHDDQADVGQRGEDRRAGAHDHAHVARDGGLAHRPALAVRDAGMEDGDLLAEAGGEAARGLRRERDLRHEHEHRAPAGERALGGPQVDLGLARPRDPVEQEIAPARLEQLLDPRDGGAPARPSSESGGGVRPARTVGTRRRASSCTSPSSASRRTVAAVVVARATSSVSGSGPSASSASSARRRSVVPGAPVAETQVSRGARTRGGSASASARAGVEP